MWYRTVWRLPFDWLYSHSQRQHSRKFRERIKQWSLYSANVIVFPQSPPLVMQTHFLNQTSNAASRYLWRNPRSVWIHVRKKLKKRVATLNSISSPYLTCRDSGHSAGMLLFCHDRTGFTRRRILFSDKLHLRWNSGIVWSGTEKTDFPFWPQITRDKQQCYDTLHNWQLTLDGLTLLI